MKKGLLISAIILVGFIGFIVLCFVSTYVCAHYCQYAEGNKEYASFLLRFCEFRMFIGDNAEVIGTAVTAAATISIAIFTLNLRDSTKSTLLHDQRTERAYFFPDISISAPLGITPRGGAGSKVVVRFTNSGKTPGIIRQLRAYPIFSDSVPEALINHSRANAELPPGVALAMSGVYFEVVTVNISPTEWGEMDRLEKKLYIVGMIGYDDISQERRETGFCWEFMDGRFIISKNTPLNYYT